MTYMIEEISSKDVNTKFGPKPAYRIKANGAWFSYGFKKPTFKVGDNVAFNASEGKYGPEVDVATVRLLASGGTSPGGPIISTDVATVSVTPSRPYGPPAKVFPVPKTHGDRSIIRQNALTNARESIVALAVAGKEKFENDEVLAAKIISLAKQFESYTSGDLDAFMPETAE
jgi:hypothetical protein